MIRNVKDAHTSPNNFGLPDENEIFNVAEALFPTFIETTQKDREEENLFFDGGEYDSVTELSDAYKTEIGDFFCPILSPKNREIATKEPDGAKRAASCISTERIRSDFPALSKIVNGQKLVWFDNAATTHRPKCVVDRLTYFYEHENSNVHRGAHILAEHATDVYEAARQKVADFIGAPDKDNIIFVRGATEGINLVATSYVKPVLKAGDEIILTALEHHSNIVPWQIIAESAGAVLRVAPIDDDGQIILSEYERLFNERTRFVSAAHISNALGTVTPIKDMIKIAHGNNVKICVDGAQSAAHVLLNVVDMDADFFVFSGHKLYAPFGIGAVYGKSEVLKAARPYQGGGNMIEDVTFEHTIYRGAPAGFEAGTGSIADAAGLGAAIDYISSIGMRNIEEYEKRILKYAESRLRRITGLALVGTAKNKAGILSFIMDKRSIYDVARTLNDEGIAVRAGHHCAQPALRRFGVEGTVRLSFAFYNTCEEIDRLVLSLNRLR
ncbi:MAG: cysteine desulfurase [Clostridiales bacterium]|jgi:cysteine desulfurase/selenocysteine lyase|nr:cysteine desulfurase [Clostridiales bacterium]